MEMQTIICLVVFAGTLIAFALNRLPIALTAMLGMTVMVLTGCLKPAEAAAALSSSTVVQLGSMFVLAGAFGRTRAIGKLAKCVSNISRGSSVGMIAAYVVLAAVLQNFVGSAVATFTMLYPLMLACCKELRISPSKVMLPVGMVCICCGSTLPTSGAVNMIAVLRGYLETYGMHEYADIPLLRWSLARLPAFLVMIVYSIFVTPKFLPDRIDIESLVVEEQRERTKDKALTEFQERATLIIFVVALLAIILNKRIGIPGWQSAFVGALLVVAIGTLRGKELWNSMGLNMIFLYVGTNGIATALSATGAADIVGNTLTGVFGNHPNGYLVGFVFFLVPFLLTQIMSNAAVNYIFTPITIMCMQSLGANPIGPCILVIIAALSSFMTPMATPAVPVIMSAGGYTQMDIFKASVIPSVLLCLSSVLWTMTLFPLY